MLAWLSVHVKMWSKFFSAGACYANLWGPADNSNISKLFKMLAVDTQILLRKKGPKTLVKNKASTNV